MRSGRDAVSWLPERGAGGRDGVGGRTGRKRRDKEDVGPPLNIRTWTHLRGRVRGRHKLNPRKGAGQGSAGHGTAGHGTAEGVSDIPSRAEHCRERGEIQTQDYPVGRLRVLGKSGHSANIKIQLELS